MAETGSQPKIDHLMRLVRDLYSALCVRLDGTPLRDEELAALVECQRIMGGDHATD
ncbi:hypothetical protein TG4357_03340 [Thalassovita gelatinovora]|uniref:Uncharacterized protein n=1 Tax=Thalassovita gelatinovora TaxID=53501 RepID=A0A0P1G550_THAGE|nr:hypothetical protein [Thalassovita gelatinovora]QIZ81580.1 hypothetical protein HFZ77_14385 [Thalassovita gelatinovora]CUH68014.1 hypothetical protein TG4357_03340 [Thalassovita gelatinovora]SEQ27483.1 hypothetical protein SAMN04488043_104211 [Thalassovita gelatinovora]